MYICTSFLYPRTQDAYDNPVLILGRKRQKPPLFGKLFDSVNFLSEISPKYTRLSDFKSITVIKLLYPIPVF